MSKEDKFTIWTIGARRVAVSLTTH